MVYGNNLDSVALPILEITRVYHGDTRVFRSVSLFLLLFIFLLVTYVAGLVHVNHALLIDVFVICEYMITREHV